MSPAQQLVAFLGVFGGVFGLMLAGVRVLNRGQGELVTADGPPDPARPAPRPPAPGEDPKAVAYALRLHRAGIDLEPERYRTRVLRIAMLLAVVGLVMGGFGPGGGIFGLVLGAAAYKGGDLFIDYKHGKRQSDFTDQFADALGVMANGAKSGQTVIQTLETVAEDFDNPLRIEVEEVLGELRMGVPLDEALENWVQRMPGEDLEIAATALTVQRQTGGNVADILDTVALTIRDRHKLHKQISALTATGRMSGWVMGLLPVGMFVAMYFIAPARTGLLLTNPLGMVLTAIGSASIMLGGYFIRKIVTIEV